LTDVAEIARILEEWVPRLFEEPQRSRFTSNLLQKSNGKIRPVRAM